MPIDTETLDADTKEAINQLETAYKKVLLIVQGINQKGYNPKPVINQDLDLVRIDVERTGDSVYG